MFKGSLVDAWVLHTALKIKGHLACSLSMDHQSIATLKLLNQTVYLHGVGFSRASLSIRKYADVVAIDAGCHQRLDLLKDLIQTNQTVSVLASTTFSTFTVQFITSSCVA